MCALYCTLYSTPLVEVTKVCTVQYTVSGGNECMLYSKPLVELSSVNECMYCTLYSTPL